jgi:hypothetical protein
MAAHKGILFVHASIMRCWQFRHIVGLERLRRAVERAANNLLDLAGVQIDARTEPRHFEMSIWRGGCFQFVTVLVMIYDYAAMTLGVFCSQTR